jgi:hypothetical protein
MFAAFDAGPAPLTADGWHLYSLFPSGYGFLKQLRYSIRATADTLQLNISVIRIGDLPQVMCTDHGLLVTATAVPA